MHIGLSEFSLWAMKLLSAAFLAILFLQSGLDKVIDRSGNLEFLTSHFAKSPLAKTVKPMFFVITLAELSAGILSAVGALCILMGKSSCQAASFGAIVAACALTALFLGQRVAKDYAGAAGLVPYFLLALASIYIQVL